MNIKNTKLKGSSIGLWVYVLLFGGVVILWIFSWWGISAHWDKWYARSGFGDAFGAVNALFSGLAFAGVIIAIRLQSKELQLQREELEQTREELRGQKEQLERQANYFDEQNFENKFFQMLRMHESSIEGMRLFIRRYKGPNDISENYVGQEYLKLIFGLIKVTLPTMDKYEMKRHINDSFISAYNDHRIYLGHYFILLGNIFKFVHTSKSMHKQFYIDVIKSALSSYELAILYYYCFTSHGEPFYEYAVAYSLFENLHLNLINLNSLGYFPRSVYGDRDGSTYLDSITFAEEPVHTE